MSTNIDVAIIGAGIVGLAIGREIAERFPRLAVSVLEKDAEIANQQTGHNSGVIHSGIYYKPGSLKAKLCTEGAEAMIRFCKETGVPYQSCGKVIVATEAEELGRLDDLFQRGQKNGVRDLRMLNSGEIREIEPHAAGIRGIQVPGTAIVNYRQVASQYSESLRASGGEICLSHEVIALRRFADHTVIETTQGRITAGLVINCAGLQSDRVRRMATSSKDLAIVPFRGEYYEISPNKRHLVRGLIYPVPDPQFPFLGVHLTKRVSGGVEAGPNAVLALKREGYTKRSFAAEDVLDFVSFPGFWKMASKHWAMSLGEFYRSWSKAAFVRALQRLLPELSSEDLVPGGSGVRAQALNRDGTLIDDFHVVFSPGMVHVCNVPSPAATASLAIAKYIVDNIERETGGLCEKSSFAISRAGA